jgi:hypothetical protein
MPILALPRAPNWPWSKTKLLPEITEFNVGISTKPKLTSLRPPRPTTDDDRSDTTTTRWQWSCPAGHPPTPSSHCYNLSYLDPLPIKLPLQRQRTTKRHRRTHFLPSAHQRCLHRIRQRNTRNPPAIPHFATRTKRLNKSWLLRQQPQSPRRHTSPPTTTKNSPPTIKCKTSLPTRASCLNANATTWPYPITIATTNDINTTNNIDTCDLNLNPVKTTISKSHNLSGRHTNVDTDASNAQSLYTPPPDASTSYDSTDPTVFADSYPPTSATSDHHTNANTTPPLR